jgi:hypothetical protein
MTQTGDARSMSNRADESGVRASAGILEGLIEGELTKGLPSTRILLAGFGGLEAALQVLQ